ncbi:MAG: hypothetical protein J0H74_03635 [Chitinophagaceae bacterium]|nr:hypothetical protein [Chitinophagaceae bacterium]
MPIKNSLLRTLAPCLSIAVIFSSCSHSGSSDGNPVNNSYLASARTIGPDGILIDSFAYDAQHRVATFRQIATNGTDSGTMTSVFNFSGNTPLPDSYVYTQNDGTPETHVLTFDGQGRIIKDTSAGVSKFVTYYTYAGDNIICRIFFAGDLSSDAFVDTLIVKGGNMTGAKVWGWDHGVGQWEDQEQTTFGHATAANPGYKAEIAGAVGPLLHVLSVYNFGGHADYISKNIINKITGVVDGLPAGGITYTVHADASGRVSELTPNGVGAAGYKTVYTYY